MTHVDDQTRVTPYRMFDAAVLRVTPLSPSLVRVTFGGPDLNAFADRGDDQRIKLILPLPESGLDHLARDESWYAHWRSLPAEQQNPIRTYTARAVRPEQGEVDVDLVRHGDAGPASRWVGTAAPGDVVALLGPDARFDGDCGGREWRPAPGVRQLLLAGDETAVPAIASILEGLPLDSSGHVLLEVPEAGDVLDLRSPHGIQITWLARSGARHGAYLVPAVEAAARQLLPTALADLGALPDLDDDEEELWDVPEPAVARGAVYAWIAGEAAVVRTLRRHLVQDRGLDRRSVAFMGYWREGRAEG